MPKRPPFSKESTHDRAGASAPVFILVRPQMAENVGMAARAMLNCGIYHMRLVAPREDHLSDVAIRASSGAEAILKNAVVYETLGEAMADLTTVLATTARPRGMEKNVYTPEGAVDFLNKGKVGILFGPERTGLENDDVSLADAIIEIPLNPEHTSLNLSQAVLLVGYACWRYLAGVPLTEVSEKATKEELLGFLDHLDDLLQDRGYFRIADKKPRMQRNLNNIFTRADLTGQEVRTLHGMLNALTRKEG